MTISHNTLAFAFGILVFKKIINLLTMDLDVQGDILSNIQEEINRGISVTALLSCNVQFNALALLCFTQERSLSPHYY
ncbi:hypothetical protein Lal_00009292 [Lupinus albus]|nr:hypothetical protein Lal_00009292 [Lupinus albus]